MHEAVSVLFMVTAKHLMWRFRSIMALYLHTALHHRAGGIVM